MKFGGTSVGTPEALIQSAEIIQNQRMQWDHLVVVISAMSGITDALIKCANLAVQNGSTEYLPVIDSIHERQIKTIEALSLTSDYSDEVMSEINEYISDLKSFCNSINVIGEVTPRGMDAISSFGERMNIRILATLLNNMGMQSEAVDAMDLIITDDTYQNAVPINDLTKNKTTTRLKPLLDKSIIPVITGFIGSTEKGVITTLGRGGSDYTAAIIGDCLNTTEVWIWTDVDGVMTADPRVAPNARSIPDLSYNEVSEMAYFGAKVLHPKTIRPVVERDIPLWVKNTFNPSHPGTRISKQVRTSPGIITAITTIKDVSMITVEGKGMLGVPGIAGRTFTAVARQKASVLMISQSSSEQSICFIIPTSSVKVVIHSIEDAMALEFMRGDIDRVWSQDNIVIVSVIGAGLRYTPGVSARIFGALGKKQINVLAIAQGSSEYSISVVVDAANADDAVRAVHNDVIIAQEKQ
jgi:aspartate kinase